MQVWPAGQTTPSQGGLPQAPVSGSQYDPSAQLGAGQSDCTHAVPLQT